MKFEWDETKRESNLSKHGVDFVDAALLLMGKPLIAQSPRPGSDAVRYVAVGAVNENLYTTVYTMRGNLYRIISVRSASREEKQAYRVFLDP